ncbi:MAG: type III-B CRISPR module-associated protein Cmr5 [Moorellales bacterium]
MTPTLDQLRARHALESIRTVERSLTRAEDRRAFVSKVESLPAGVLANGLGQALAILLAQANNDSATPPGMIYGILQEWLCRDDPRAPYRGAASLVDALVNGSRTAYIWAQEETLAYLKWLKTFAVAFLKEREAVR